MTTELTIRKRELQVQANDKMLEAVIHLVDRLLSNSVVTTIGGLVLVQALSNHSYLVKAPGQNNDYYRIPYVDKTAGAVLQATLAGSQAFSALASASGDIASVVKLLK